MTRSSPSAWCPSNDAPTIDDWNLQTGDTINWASNDSSLIYGEWTIRVLEDTEAPAELTFDLSALKNDVDHDLSDLTWSLLPSSTTTAARTVPTRTTSRSPSTVTSSCWTS